MIDRRTLMLGTLAAGLAARAAAEPPPGPLLPEPDIWLDLWPGEAPGLPSPPPVEEVRERSTDASFNDRAIFHVRRPRMAVFRPARPNGSALLITPGGSYARVVMDKEGFESARWFAARGITVFVLFYRLALDRWASAAETSLTDAKQAMRLVRAAPGVDPRRVCVLGFSAGGHVAADLVARYGEAACRPDAAALFYPVIAMNGPAAHAESRLNLLGPDATAEDERVHSPALNLTAQAPPCFLLHAEDDTTNVVQNTLIMRDALRAQGVAAETHLFPDGGHGFGIRLARGHSVEIWPELMHGWGRRQGLWS
jgi:acetyl esterase/lipase